MLNKHQKYMVYDCLSNGDKNQVGAYSIEEIEELLLIDGMRFQNILKATEYKKVVIPKLHKEQVFNEPVLIGLLESLLVSNSLKISGVLFYNLH